VKIERKIDKEIERVYIKVLIIVDKIIINCTGVA